jgi:hypothetical protein
MQARQILGLLYGAIEALAQQPEDTPTALDDARELVHAMLEGWRGAGKNTATALPQA